MPAEIKWEGTAAYDVARKRLMAQKSTDKTMTVEQMRKDMAGKANVNFEDLSWPVGTSFTVPGAAVLEKSLFCSSIDGNKAFGITVLCDNGMSKNLYLSSLKKSLVPYKAAGEGFAIDEDKPICQSDTPFYQEVMNCPTENDIFNLIASKKGKKIKVDRVLECQTAKMSFADKDSGPIPVGLKKGKVCCFVVE